LQWSFIGSLSGQDLTQGWAHLSFPGDAGPFAALAGLAGLVWLSVLLYSDAFISPYSTGLVYSTTAARMLASMGKVGDIPPVFNARNHAQAPWVSLFANFFLAIMMFCLLHNWQAMASFLVSIMMVSYAVGPISLVCLRKQMPHHQRPFRLRCSKLIAFIGFYICTAGVYWAGKMSLLKLLGLTCVGLLLYFLYRCFRKSSQDALNGKNALWLIGYLVGLGIFSYFGNYGGTRQIPLYWDLLYLMVFSLVIFTWAIKTARDDYSLHYYQKHLDSA
jgi:amino acid transporter